MAKAAPVAARKPGAMAGAIGKFGGKGSADTALLEKQMAELQSNNQTLDKEREFYFSKLRLIEEMITKNGLEANPVCDTVLKILYAGEDEEMDIAANGDLVIRAGGQEVIHPVQTEGILP